MTNYEYLRIIIIIIIIIINFELVNVLKINN